jgi:hypothetical protein
MLAYFRTIIELRLTVCHQMDWQLIDEVFLIKGTLEFALQAFLLEKMASNFFLATTELNK